LYLAYCQRKLNFPDTPDPLLWRLKIRTFWSIIIWNFYSVLFESYQTASNNHKLLSQTPHTSLSFTGSFAPDLTHQLW